MNNPNHTSESLETVFWIKILKFFDADPGWKKYGSGIRDKHPRFVIVTLLAVANNSGLGMTFNVRNVSLPTRPVFSGLWTAYIYSS